MAKFQLSNDAFKFFENLQELKTKFDIYYFCIVAGLTTGRADELPSQEFVDYFIDDYKPVKHLLIGLLINAELKRAGIALNEKEAVRSKIKKLIDPSSSTLLTDSGVARLNAYADGGYLHIREKLGIKPYSTPEFIVGYTEMMNSYFENDKAL